MVLRAAALWMSVEAVLSFALELFHVVAYAVQFLGDVDALGAVGRALAAAYAVVGLAQFGYRAVIAHEERAALLGIGRRGLFLRCIALV